MIETFAHGVNAGGVTSFHVTPPSAVDVDQAVVGAGPDAIDVLSSEGATV